jgi:DNA-binding transcriptional LysR family regulator
MDLNLIKVFNAIYETRSLTQAGQRLFVSQSAISQSLGKLRFELDDQLFEKVGREMQPNEKADQIYEHFKSALEEIFNAIEVDSKFDPKTSDKVFKIGLSELGEIGWLPEILSELAEFAPQIRIDVVQLDNAALANDLNRGKIDLAISPLALSSHEAHKNLKLQKYVVLMSKKNRLAKEPLTLSDYRSAARIEVISDSGAPLIAEAHSRIAGLRAPIARIQHFATLPTLIANSESFISIVPSSIADTWIQKWNLAVKDIPFKMSPINLRLYKRSTSDSLTALNWFFDLVVNAAKISGTDFQSINN